MSEPKIYFVAVGEAYEQPADSTDTAMVEKIAFDALKKEFEAEQAEIARLKFEYEQACLECSSENEINFHLRTELAKLRAENQALKAQLEGK